MNDRNNRVLVLADDFTGANDAGVSLAEAGMSVEVAFTAGQPSTARALILNSDSRAMTAAAAADKVAALLRGAATFVPHWQVKKIDSTLRGNPGGELEAMMAAQGCRMAVVGSMSEMAQRQVAALQVHSRVRVIEIDVEQTFSGSPKEEASRIAGALREGQHCVVTTRPNHAARHGIEARCRERGLSRAAYGEHICAWLADVTAQAVAQSSPGALYLSGGDVAIAVAHALGATGFQIRGRVAECVPYGHFLGGRWSRPVMTKAGGFGTDTTLLHVVNFIEEKLSV
ncbi:TPA: four-carbon acid sugar kinase family protein [Klebsiella pneumoniae]